MDNQSQSTSLPFPTPVRLMTEPIATGTPSMRPQLSVLNGAIHTKSTLPGVRRSAPPTILVVDDEPLILNFLSDLLEDEGYRVCNARNGREAIQVLHRESPHLVISDLTMPDMDGNQLLYYVHSGACGQAPKMILMSAIEPRGAKSGVPFLHKPFDIEELLELVDSTLEDGAPVARLSRAEPV